MMPNQICLITDLHWGARNDSQYFIDYYERFYEDVFFPTLEARNIDTVVITGDVFDRRKYISFVTLNHAKRIFFNKLHERNIQTYILVGNHDAPYKNTIRINSIDLLLKKKYPNITVISHPGEYNIKGHDLCMIPWICSENMIDAITLMETTEASICLGHFEINGFAMYRGVECHEGMDRDIFRRFELVCSGHYHHRSIDGNITYLGNPYELTWQDYNDDRGFHILDLDTRDLEFIQNPYKMFKKVNYDDLSMTRETIDQQDMGEFKGSYVKVIIKTKNNPLLFDYFIEKLEKIGVVDIQVVEDHLNLGIEDDSDIINEAEDTITIINKCIEGMNLQQDAKQIELLMQELYNEALTIS